MVTTMFILDRTLNTSHILTANKNSKSVFWDDCYTQEFDTGAETLEFSCYTHESVREGNYVTFFYNSQYKMFQITEIEEVHKSGRLVAECYCETASLQLLNNYVRPFNGDMNCIQFFEHILSGTEWRIGKYSNSLKDKVMTINESNVESVWSLIEDYKDIFECEINVYVTYENGHVTGQFIDIFSEKGLGSATYKRFEYGKNVTGITKSKDLYDWCTAIIVDCNCDVTNTIINENQGYGFVKGAGDVILDDNHNRMYNAGRTHVVGVYSGDETEPIEACINAWKELEKRSVPKFDYQVTTALRDDEYEEIHLGDTVYVVDHSYTPPLLLEARVGKLELSFTDRSNNKCTLTNYKEIKSKLLDADYIKLTGTITDIVNAFFPITSEGIADGAICEGKIETTYFQQITADIVSAGIGAFENLYAQGLTVINADIEKLNASSADITDLKAQVAEIDTLVNGHLTSDNIQSMVITGDKFTVADGFIKNAMIDNITADKITTGSINTDNVYISSEDGSMIINGSLQQFKDKNGKVRIQIGKDAQDNFTFSLFDENGTGVLINEKGITENAIADGLIVDNHVADNANISGSKLDIDSVVTEINNGTSTIKGTKVVLDENNQTLNVAFNSLETKIDDIEIGGANLLTNTDFLVEHTKDTSSITPVEKPSVPSSELQRLIGKTVTLSYYVHCPGERENLSTSSSTNNRFGIHGTAVWTDSTGVNADKIQYPFGDRLTEEFDNERISKMYTLTPPAGYDTLSSFSFSVQAFSKPASTNNATWKLGYPQLEVGNKATDWQPSSKDVKDKIDGMEIGARNLYIIKNSVGGYVTTGYTIATPNATRKERTSEFIPIEPNTEYQLQSWVTVPNVGTEYPWQAVCFYDVDKYGFDSRIHTTDCTVLSNGISHTLLSFKTPSSASYVRVSARTYEDGLIKLEKGTKPTDWTPAPEDIEEKITSNTTAINVQQGQIDTLITNTTITKDGQTVTLKDDYNITKNTVNSQSTKIGSLESSFNNLSIGGKNLVKNSKTLTSLMNSSGMWHIADSSISGHKQLQIDTTNTSWVEVYAPLYSPINTLTGEITISFEYTESVNELLVVNLGAFNNYGRKAEISNTVVSRNYTITDTADGWKKAYFVENRLEKVNNIDEATQYCLQFKKVDGKTGSIKIRKIQVEKGNRPTDYSPSIEDTEAQVNSVVSKQASMELDLNGFKTEVSNTYIDKKGYVGVNFIKNGRMEGAKRFTKDIPEWSHWGNFEVYDNPYAYGEKYVCIRPKADSTSTVGGIYQPIYKEDIPKNTQVTLSYQIGWEANVNGAWVDITYYKNDGTKVGTTYEINKGKTGFFTHTFTTQNVDYDYFRVGVVMAGTKGNPSGSFLVYFGNVKLELGNVATAWCDNHANYTTKTTFQQSNEDFTFRVSQSGGGNLFKNTKFKEGTKYWAGLQWDDSNIDYWNIHVMNARIAWNMNDVNGLEYGGRVKNAGGVIRGGFDTPRVVVEPGRTYSFSCYLCGARCDSVTVELCGSNFDGNWENWGAIFSGAVGANTQWDRNFKDWTRITYTFTASPNMRDISFRFFMNNHVAGTAQEVSMMIALPCLVEGDIPKSWCPHESELYDGIVRIDQDGITVQQGNNSSLLDSQALKFYSGSSMYSMVDGGIFKFANPGNASSTVGMVGRYTWSQSGAFNSCLASGPGSSASIGSVRNSGEPATCMIIDSSQPGYITGSNRYLEQGLNIIVAECDTLHFKKNKQEASVKEDGVDAISIWGGNYNGDGLRTGMLWSADSIAMGICYAGLYCAMRIIETEYDTNHNTIHMYGPVNMNGFEIYNCRSYNTLSARSSFTQSLLNSGSNELFTYGAYSFSEGEVRWCWKETVFTYPEADIDPQTDEWVYTGRNICYIELPIFLAENIEADYHIQVGKIGWGDYRILEKNQYYFILESQEEDFAFTFEIVAKLIDGETLSANASLSNMATTANPAVGAEPPKSDDGIVMEGTEEAFKDMEILEKEENMIIIKDEVIEEEEEELQDNINIGEE